MVGNIIKCLHSQAERLFDFLSISCKNGGLIYYRNIAVRPDKLSYTKQTNFLVGFFGKVYRKNQLTT